MSTKFVIDYLLPSRNYYLLWATAAVILLMYLLKSLCNVLGGYLLTYTSLYIVFDVRRRLFEHLQLLHLAFYEKEQSGKLVSKLINDATALQDTGAGRTAGDLTELSDDPDRFFR